MPRPLLILLPFPEVDTLFEPRQGIAHTRRCIQLHAKLTAFSDCRSFEEKIFDTWWQKPTAKWWSDVTYFSRTISISQILTLQLTRDEDNMGCMPATLDLASLASQSSVLSPWTFALCLHPTSCRLLEKMYTYYTHCILRLSVHENLEHFQMAAGEWRI